MGNGSPGFGDWTNLGVTPAAIREPTFDTGRRGFEQGQVLAFLARVAAHVEHLTARIKGLELDVAEKEAMLAGAVRHEHEAPAEEATAKTDPYDEVASHVAELMRAFDEDIGRLRHEAEADADRIVTEARAEAERLQAESEKLQQEVENERARILSHARGEAKRIHGEAQGQADQLSGAAERTVREAEAKANAVLSDLTDRRAALLGDIGAIRERLVAMAADLEAVIAEGASGGHVVVLGDAVRSDRGPAA